jgi:hypothetical protein
VKGCFLEIPRSKFIATQIVLFAPGSNRLDAEPGPDNAQLVATINNTKASPEGLVLTVADKDGDRKITIGPDTAIWIARAGLRLRKGAERTLGRALAPCSIAFYQTNAKPTQDTVLPEHIMLEPGLSRLPRAILSFRPTPPL